jgi:pantetheine-phosphate adenylyltransferase
VTLGHWDIIQRAEKLVDHLVVAVLHNPRKTPAFTVDERVAMLRELVEDRPGIIITSFNGLLVDFARSQGAQFIVRGVRAFSDFEYEFQMAFMNRKLAPELETVFLMPKEKYSAVSSHLVREIGIMGGNLSDLVPDVLREQIAGKLSKR